MQALTTQPYLLLLMPLDLAVVILTYNEAIHIRRALDSVAHLASEVYVIDSGSSDGTAEIAATYGATVLTHKFANYAKQFQWALDNAPISATWIMRLDADEVIEDDLASELLSKLPNLPDDVAGINLKRKHIFMGRWIRFGGRYPLVLLRIWRRGQGRIEDRWMDEHMVISGGRTVTMEGGFADHNLNDLNYFINKHNKYATREAIDVLNQRLALFSRDLALNAASASWQAASKRFIKENIYNRLPFEVSATLYFLWRYLFQWGFLDGRPGLVYHFLQGYWYRFLVGARLLELEQTIAGLTERADIVRELQRSTGLPLEEHPLQTGHHRPQA